MSAHTVILSRAKDQVVRERDRENQTRWHATRSFALLRMTMTFVRSTHRIHMPPDPSLTLRMTDRKKP